MATMRRGFTYIEMLVAIGILVFVLAMAVIYINRARTSHSGVQCARNLRQIGQAILLYANGEKNGAYPRTLADESGSAILTNQGWQASNPFDARVGTNNIGASLFLLLRTQDISAEVFTCPSADSERDLFGGGTNTAMNRANFTDMEQNLSYSVQNMFPDAAAAKAGFRWDKNMNPDFPVLADKNPGVGGVGGLVADSDVFRPTGPTDSTANQRLANSLNHDRDGQNVLFAGGSVQFVPSAWVGVSKDNIYTRAGRRAFGPNCSPADANDSILLPVATPRSATRPTTTTTRP